MPQLYSFHLIDSNDIHLIDPLTSNLQILSNLTLSFINKRSSITNLTISGCSLDQLFHHVFKYTPILTYFNFQYFSQHYNQTINYPNDNINKAVHLKELSIFNFKYKFKDFKRLAKQIPKLTNLTVRSLKPIINLSKLKYLNISFTFKIKDAYVLLRILLESPQISSLMISIHALEHFAYNKEIC
ncbi:unnamed protein product [Rotaria sordida]|uniref:Uncharacterized protein n=1 Tax=Rotaria sordida TaxID=392033 RepID=A0A815F4L3_9BILA|nr:unnamed protein product [Rotaria sordida]CAF1585784.1 unnamed protein product [Rotaria sordida]